MFFCTGYSGQRKQISLKRHEICEIIKDNITENNDALLTVIEEHLSEIHKQTVTLSVEVKANLRKLAHKCRTKLQECNRHYERFIENNKSWLEIDVNLGEIKHVELEQPSTGTIMGRPSTSFEDSSDRTKRRRAQSIREQCSQEELAYATEMSLRAGGKLDASKVLHDIMEGSPTRATRYRQSLYCNSERKMTNDEALSFIIENKLSKNMYNNIRSTSVEHNCKLYPSYKDVLQAKKQCYPSTSEITITECSAEVRLQALLDHTIQRILLVQKEVIKSHIR